MTKRKGIILAGGSGTPLPGHDGCAEKAARVASSVRGELEITTLLEKYLAEGTLAVEIIGRGNAWLDTGTHESLMDADTFVRTPKTRKGLQMGSPDEICFKQGRVDSTQLRGQAASFSKNADGQYLRALAQQPHYPI